MNRHVVRLERELEEARQKLGAAPSDESSTDDEARGDRPILFPFVSGNPFSMSTPIGPSWFSRPVLPSRPFTGFYLVFISGPQPISTDIWLCFTGI